MVVNNHLRVPCSGGDTAASRDTCNMVGSSNCDRVFFPQRTCLGPHIQNNLYFRQTRQRTIDSLHARRLLPREVDELPRVTP